MGHVKRIISFDPSEFEEAGDRNGILTGEITSYRDPRKTYEAFKEAYAKQKGGKSK